MTGPKHFYFSPDPAHLHLADYNDARRAADAKPDSFDIQTIYDLGDGESDERSGAYVVNQLESIYA
jgi:hypothetical protein